MALIIDEKQLKGKPKKVGKLGGKPVWEAESKGGLFMVMANQDGKPELIGTGPHPDVARYMAEQRHEGLQWTELQKADRLELQHFQHLLPEYELLLARMQALMARDDQE